MQRPHFRARSSCCDWRVAADRRTILFKALLIVFCFFSATGSFPVDVLGAKLSNVFTLAFCAVMPLFLPGKSSYSARLAPLVMVGTLFMMWQSLTALWAPDIAFSAYRALVVNGYMFLALALPIATAHRSIDLIAMYGRVALAASALLVVTYAAFLPLGARAVYPQLFLPSMVWEPLDDFDLNDPNIVACALSVGLICALATIRDRRWRLLGASIFAIAILITQSRTAILFLPVAAFLAAIVTRNAKAALISLLAMTALAGVGIAVYDLLGNVGDASGMTDAFQERFLSDSASNDDRLERLQGALVALQKPVVALFGLGAGGSISSGLEPHNMFLSFFLELGFFGLTLFCGIFFLIGGLVSGMADREKKYYCAWLLLFVLFASLTYWHTRTLWFSISLIIFASLQQQHRPVRRRTRSLPALHMQAIGSIQSAQAS